MQIKDARVLVLGCGSIGRRHADVLADMGLTDIAVYDPVPAQAEMLCKQVPAAHAVASYEAGLAEKPDAVFICVPTAMHLEAASAALRAGCHVFMEKPLAESVKGTDDFLKLVEETGKKVSVGFCFRYHEGVLRLKKLMDDGVIGRLVSVRSMMGEHFPDVRPDYKTIYYAKYSGAFELIHDLDLTLWLAGQPVAEAHSVYGPFSNIGIEAPDTVEILLRFADRRVGTVHLDFFQTPRRRELELIGDEGTAKLSFGSWDEYTLSWYSRSDKETKVITAPSRRNDMFVAEDTEFLEAVLNGGALSCPVEEAMRSLRVVEDITGGNL